MVEGGSKNRKQTHNQNTLKQHYRITLGLLLIEMLKTASCILQYASLTTCYYSLDFDTHKYITHYWYLMLFFAAYEKKTCLTYEHVQNMRCVAKFLAKSHDAKGFFFCYDSIYTTHVNKQFIFFFQSLILKANNSFLGWKKRSHKALKLWIFSSLDCGLNIK